MLTIAGVCLKKRKKEKEGKKKEKRKKNPRQEAISSQENHVCEKFWNLPEILTSSRTARQSLFLDFHKMAIHPQRYRIQNAGKVL